MPDMNYSIAIDVALRWIGYFLEFKFTEINGSHRVRPKQLLKKYFLWRNIYYICICLAEFLMFLMLDLYITVVKSRCSCICKS